MSAVGHGGNGNGAEGTEEGRPGTAGSGGNAEGTDGRVARMGSGQSAKGQTTGAAAGLDEAKGTGGHCSAGNIGRAQGDGSGGGIKLTARGSSTGTAVMAGNRAWTGSGLRQMTGVAGGIDGANGNGMGVAVAEAVMGWSTSGQEAQMGFDDRAPDRSGGDGANRAGMAGSGTWGTEMQAEGKGWGTGTGMAEGSCNRAWTGRRTSAGHDDRASAAGSSAQTEGEGRGGITELAAVTITVQTPTLCNPD